MRSRVAACGAIVGLIISMPVAQASEVWVRQAHGSMPAGASTAEEGKPVKNAPEGTTATAAGSPTTPATCNQQNASSPACYSATQQTKPTGK